MADILDYPEITAPTVDDAIYLVNDADGEPSDGYCTLENLFKNIITSGNMLLSSTTGFIVLRSTNSSIYIDLGDNAGAAKLRIRDSDFAEVASIDSNGNAFFDLDCSALTFTDRTPFYKGDALKEICKIKGKGGKIDHSTLPDFVRKTKKHGKKEIEVRDIGAMLSMLTVAVQQIEKRIQ